MTTRCADELMLVAIPTAACCARMFAAATLTRWGVTPDEPVLNAVEVMTVLAVDASKPDLLGYTPCSAPGLMETSKPGRNTSDARTEEVQR